MIEKVRPINRRTVHNRTGVTPSSGSHRRGVNLGTLLLVGFSAVTVLADEPRLGFVLRPPDVQVAQPLMMQGIRIEHSAPFGAAAFQAEQQTPSGTEAPRQESIQRPAPVRDYEDPGIRPMRDIGIDITPPPALDSSGHTLPPPDDFASAVYWNQPPFPRGAPSNGPWFEDAAYGPPLNFCYRPLYFEEVNLERYGHTAGIWQPFVSASHFCGNVAVLPYRLVSQPSGRCVYHAHQYRPGELGPRERQVWRFRLDAATVQTAAVVGLIFLIP